MYRDVIQVPDFRITSKYENRKSSWYTLYPIQGQWEENHAVAAACIEQALDEYVADPNRQPLELYVHFPFCHSQCFFCQCATVISRSYGHYTEFLDSLAQEVQMYVTAFRDRGLAPNFTEIHFGGGTPSLLNPEDFEHFIEILSPLADVRAMAEVSLEIDPRHNVDPDKLHFYSRAGVTRVSFGIQDFDPAVQKAVNRINPPEMIAELVQPDIRRHFTGVNFDILYGLPFQSLDTLSRTIDTSIAMQPDRICVYLLGHRPDIFPHQRAYRTEDCPDLETLMRMKVETANHLMAAGYQWIGIDHFVKPTDSFAVARTQRTLCRSVSGYGTGRGPNTLGLGPSAVTTLGRYYLQSYYTLIDYQEALGAGRFPVLRSQSCSGEDLLRRQVIFDLILFSEVRKEEIEQKFAVDFDEYFADDLKRLAELEADGLVAVSRDKIMLTDTGRLMPRHVCAQFDYYANNTHVGYAHSREIGNGLQSLRRTSHFGAGR